MNAKTLIEIESPRAAGVPELIAALDDYLSSLYPPSSNHFLDLEQLAQPDIRFFVARRDGAPLACGALRVADGYGEVKRMYVAPAARGRRVDRLILDRLLEHARDRNIAVLRLETGDKQMEALSLYRSVGFADRGPFADYPDNESSIYMELKLA